MPISSPFAPVPVSNESLHEKLLSAAWSHGSLHPSRPAFILAANPSKYLTYTELYVQAHSVSAYLRSQGFRQGDIACLVIHNCIEWPVFAMGAWAAGGAISGASALFTDYELERQFLDSECSVVFTDEPHLQKVLHAVKNCTKIHTIICLRSDNSHVVLPGQVTDWTEVVSCRPNFDIVKVDPHKLAVLPYSSGTTGSPKGVMLSHSNFGTMIEVVKDHFEKEVMPAVTGNCDWHKEHAILNLPFYHIFGFGMLNFSILSGSTGVIIDKFDPPVYLKSLSTYRPKILFLVPPILIFLAKHPAVKEFDLSSIQFVLSGAAPAGKDICEEFLNVHKNVKYLVQAYGETECCGGSHLPTIKRTFLRGTYGYGMTECGMASHLPVLNRKDTYVGVGVIASTFEQKTIDPATGKELAIGEKGEVCVRGPTIMMGYLNKPEATAETIDKDGWLHTGDIGYIDKEGRTFVVDRLKELIKVKGLQVPPAELEDLLLSHPHIADAAVIGLPDKNRGELVRAYVVRANKGLTEEDVIKFVAHKVSEYKHITGGVRFVNEIPKSAAGKILRRIIRDDAASEAKGERSKL